MVEHTVQGMRFKFHSPEYRGLRGSPRCTTAFWVNILQTRLSQTACFLWPLCSRPSAGCFLEFLGHIWGPFIFNSPYLVVSFTPNILHNRVSFLPSHYFKTMEYLIVYIESWWIFTQTVLFLSLHIMPKVTFPLHFLIFCSVNSWFIICYTGQRSSV